VYQKTFPEGYAAPINWYLAAIDNINGEDEKGTLLLLPKVNSQLIQTLRNSARELYCKAAHNSSQLYQLHQRHGRFCFTNEAGGA